MGFLPWPGANDRISLSNSVSEGVWDIRVVSFAFERWVSSGLAVVSSSSESEALFCVPSGSLLSSLETFSSDWSLSSKFVSSLRSTAFCIIVSLFEILLTLISMSR